MNTSEKSTSLTIKQLLAVNAWLDINSTVMATSIRADRRAALLAATGIDLSEHQLARIETETDRTFQKPFARRTTKPGRMTRDRTRLLASELAKLMQALGHPIPPVVSAIVGGRDPSGTDLA